MSSLGAWDLVQDGAEQLPRSGTAQDRDTAEEVTVARRQAVDAGSDHRLYGVRQRIEVVAVLRLGEQFAQEQRVTPRALGQHGHLLRRQRTCGHGLLDQLGRLLAVKRLELHAGELALLGYEAGVDIPSA